MKSFSRQKGFTLVELAIVMTIIGLLIGGILKGQELLQNSRMTATVAQIKSYEAAMTTFHDEYGQDPGDLSNANNVIKGCTSCDSSDAGNGIVGTPSYDNSYFIGTHESSYAGAVNQQDEPYLFWQELMLAQLIGGVTADGQEKVATQYAWGVTHPAAKIGGGFIVGPTRGSNPLPGAPATLFPNAGLHLFLVSIPTDNLKTNAATAGLMPLSPLRAAQIDRKMDDGKPDTGEVTAWGFTTSCYGATAPYIYTETISSNDCGLVFAVNG